MLALALWITYDLTVSPPLPSDSLVSIARPSLGAPAWIESDLERARHLLDEAEELLSSGRPAEAAGRFQQAEALFAALEEALWPERAACLRGLVRSQQTLEDDQAATEAFEALVELLPRRLEVAPEVQDELGTQVQSAYSDLSSAAASRRKQKPAIDLLEACRAVLKKSRYPKAAAQALHDLGALSGQFKDLDAADQHLEKAVREWQKLEDGEWVVRSSLEHAHWLLQDRELEAALGPLESAHEEMLRGVGLEGELRWAGQVHRLANDSLASEVERAVVEWMWERAEQVAGTPSPTALPADDLARTAAELQLSREGPKRASKVAKRLLSLELSSVPPEVQVDLILNAAATLLLAGQSRKAREELEAIQALGGPCWEHLEARRHVLLAVAAAEQKDMEEFVTHAEAGVRAFKSMEESAGRLAALEALVEAGRRWTAKECPTVGELEEELAQRERSGTPGGLGSLFIEGESSQAISQLGPHDPVFAVFVGDGDRLFVRDLLSEAEESVPVGWREQVLSFRGLAIRFFGGYASVVSLDYGPGSPGPSGRPAISLDDLPAYLPIPATGRLLVAKNGAVSYGAGE